jgi:glucosamine-phosphate N-acetyltransferase
MIRLISKEDYNSIFLLLNQLTESPNIDREIFNNIVLNLKDNHNIFVYILDNKVVGCITLLIEQKLIHSGKCVAHIEDLVVDVNYKNKKIASSLINYCIEISKKNNCYKIILDCKEELLEFYKKFDFNQQGICMRYSI